MSATLLKETPMEVFLRKICKIFKNRFSYGTPLVVASEESWLESSSEKK